MNKDNFEHKSKSWDMNSKRVKNAKSIGDLIVKNVDLKENYSIMDFGAGTGLLTYFIAPYVAKITAIDNSPSMLMEFKNKQSEFECETLIVEKDLSKESLDEKFDGIISSMTIHHLENIEKLFEKFYNMLTPNGFIAIADLDSEDGSFHSDNVGVYHYGFNRQELENIVKKAGFVNIEFNLASNINKPNGNFTVFLMTAFKK